MSISDSKSTGTYDDPKSENHSLKKRSTRNYKSCQNNVEDLLPTNLHYKSCQKGALAIIKAVKTICHLTKLWNIVEDFIAIVEWKS